MRPIVTPRFELIELTPNHATKHYLSWFADPHTQQFIVTLAHSLEELKTYIAAKRADEKCLFLGIFYHGSHIGNIKYEPIESSKAQATMGILIGEKDWRGKGVAGEVIMASSIYLREHYGINRILLGVEQENIAAVQAYKKLGFVNYKETPDGLYMSLDLNRVN
ncbi:Mycothiol acetyltransferase [Pseudoalteromonas sp. P1-9]|uniref:GNAT family N-acetyltransferase n=1 Tax=Pseudoalteromonas sp. P1-9 TaxID=1710354 RepID=UPI0006D63912|nr:GNAT family N-acetyltransferase [Pseudoalteromonas sp. P1-9]KPV97329.1 Mycothiol acetyltransferase [Pseudoalteromonas sp. P1-9]